MKRILLVPTWVTMRLTKNQSRAFKIILMILVLLTGLYTKEYRGEYQAIVNNKLGGVFYVLFGSLLFSLFLSRVKFYWSVFIAFGITCMLEFIQYLHIPIMAELGNYKIFAYIFGTSFDSADFLYYSIGAFVAAVVLFAFEAEEYEKAVKRERVVASTEGQEEGTIDKRQVTAKKLAVKDQLSAVSNQRPEVVAEVE